MENLHWQSYYSHYPMPSTQLTLEGEEFPVLSDERSCRGNVKALPTKRGHAYLVARVWRLVSCMPFP